jgi:hypothetical protein
VRLREIVIDSLDPPKLARFWASALSDYVLRPYDAAELARLAERGLTPDTDPSVALDARDGRGPTLWFQKTKRPKTGRNRIHLDVVGGWRADEVARLVSLGAVVRDEHARYTVLFDPEGNEFCVQEPEA